MGGASSAQAAKLKETQAQLAAQRRQANMKDAQIKRDMDNLVRLMSVQKEQAQERERFQAELAEDNEAHRRELGLLRQRLETEHERALREHLEHAAEEARLMLEEEDEVLRAEKMVKAESANHALVCCEEERAARAREELERAGLELRQLLQERDSEAEAARVTREAYAAEKRAAMRQNEVLEAEVRAQLSETDALTDTHRSLENAARTLQNELSKVSYTVGQRDHELKVKDSELSEVRQSIISIQDEMDEVNRQLKEQCSRVQRVEGSLRVSRDLGDKVRAMRDMLQESHGALAQLGRLLEQEREQRDQCIQGLRQQRLRTELLLQLLHHFKNRTQDLAPGAMLAGAPGTVLGNGGDTPTHSVSTPDLSGARTAVPRRPTSARPAQGVLRGQSGHPEAGGGGTPRGSGSEPWPRPPTVGR